MALKKNEAVVRESAPAFIYYNVSVPIHYDHCHSLPDNEVSVLYLFTFNAAEISINAEFFCC
jgi:hypothetical protein